MTDEGHRSEIELTAQLGHIVGVAVQRRLALTQPGRRVRTAGAHMIAEHDAVARGQRGDYETPQVLIAPESVGEHDRRSTLLADNCHIVPASDIHSPSLTFMHRDCAPLADMRRLE
jgi:hypothetical protein